VGSPSLFVLPLDVGPCWLNTAGGMGKDTAFHDSIGAYGGACSEELGSNLCWYGKDGMGGSHCEGWSLYYPLGSNFSKASPCSSIADVYCTIDQWVTNSSPKRTCRYDGLLLCSAYKEVECGPDGEEQLPPLSTYTVTAACVKGEAKVFKFTPSACAAAGIPGWPGCVDEMYRNGGGWKKMVAVVEGQGNW